MDSPKKRAFVMCVGTRDPFWASVDNQIIPFRSLPSKPDVKKTAGPILSFLSLAELQEGDRVILFSTQPGPKVREPTQECGKATEEEIKRRFPGVDVVHRSFSSAIDPSEFVEVYNDLKGLVSQELESLKEEYEVVVFVSPGTPQMQASWFVLAYAGRIKGKLCRISLEHGKQVIKEVDLGPLLFEDLRKAALNSFREGYFKEAIELFERLKPAYGRRASFCAELSKLYRAWFSLHYHEARKLYESLCKAYDDILRNHRNLETLMCGINADLQFSKTPAGHLATLFHTASLQLRQGHEAEALWYAASIVEAVELRLAKEAGCRTSSRSQAHEYLLRHGKPHALHSLKDEEELFKLRNESIHEGRAVGPENANKALSLAKEALTKLLDPLDLDGHSLSDAKFKEMAQALDSIFLKQ